MDSHAFNRENRQQGELEVVQPLTLSERNSERVVGFGDVRHRLERRSVDKGWCTQLLS